MKILTDLISKIKYSQKPSSKSCNFCKRRTDDMRSYRNERDQKVKVCALCVEYAERRAYRK